MNFIDLLKEFRTSRKNLLKTQKAIKDLQERKLREVLVYAYNNSTYYRRAFEQAGINQQNLLTKHISEFPTIDKQAFIENFDTIVTDKNIKLEALRKFDLEEQEQSKQFNDMYHIVHSSGSTGKPMYFVYNPDAWNKMLIGIIRAALWKMSDFEVMKLLITGPKVAYIAATEGRYGGAMAVGGGINSLKGKQLFLDINSPLKNWLAEIIEFQPNIIIGYPSAIKILADLQKNGKVSTKVTRIISCGEPLNQNMRNYFESIFKSTVINIYGSSESLALGVDAGDSDGMTLFDDLNYIEIEENEMYLTSLYNFTQPIIRYKISDKLSLKSSQEGMSKAEILLSRNEDILWFQDNRMNEDFLHPLAIEGFCLDGMLDYQFVQRGSKEFSVLIEVESSTNLAFISSEMRRMIQDILIEKKMNYVSFDIILNEKIMVNPKTGKKQLVVVNNPIVANEKFA